MGLTVVRAGTIVAFDVTVAVEGLSGFDAADVVIGSNEASDIAFAYSAAWDAAFANGNVPVATLDGGFYAQDVRAGGTNTASVGMSLLLGRVTVDTTGMAGGGYLVTIDSTVDGNTSVLSLGGITEPLSGTGAFVVMPSGAISRAATSMNFVLGDFAPPVEAISKAATSMNFVLGDFAPPVEAISRAATVWNAEGVADCNGNFSPDQEDLAAGTSSDCNTNSIPDECDISTGTSPDCNGNGVPDDCEPNDCQPNGIPDDCDIDPADPDGNGITSPDCNANGIPDECETDDCNANGIPDDCDISSGTSPDCNGNGVPDECDLGVCCFIINDALNCDPLTTKAICESPPIDGVFRGPCAECPTQNAAIFVEPGGEIFAHVIGPPVECPPPPTPLSLLSRGSCPPNPTFIDPWSSPADGLMCHNFGVAGSPAIPADFFAPGSDPFTGAVCLQGVPIGPNEFGDFGPADTLIARTQDPFSRCDLSSPSESTVAIEIVRLSLASVGPMTVLVSGLPEEWNVTVDLSTTQPPPGTLTAIKTHCNGGTYTSVLNVQPRFTFTKVTDPGIVRILDTGAEGIPPVTLVQDIPQPWVSIVDPNLGLMTDPCTDFHPGIDEMTPTQACDCDANGINDVCDPDCNVNNNPDACDVTGGISPDLDGNGVPDECQCPPAVPQPDMIRNANGSLVVSTKNRYLSAIPGNGGQATALRVTFVNLPGSFSVFNGETMWIGPPRDVSEAGGSANATPPPTFAAATLQCTPFFMDWSVAGTIHVSHENIVPGATYAVQAVGSVCDPNVESSFSAPLDVVMSRWGDLAGRFVNDPNDPPASWTAPDGVVELISDCVAILDKFANRTTAPIKARADLEPATPDRIINISDAVFCVDAFRGRSYPFDPGPPPCP